MDKSNLNVKKIPINQIIQNKNNNESRFPFKQNEAFNDNIKNFHNKYLLKMKEKNKFGNKTLFDINSIYNKIDNNIFKKDKISNNNFNINKEKQLRFNYPFKFNKFRKIRCSSQEQKNEKIALSSLPKFNFLNNEEEEENDNGVEEDINIFFDKINKEFGDIGKLIKMTFIIDENRKYDFIKNEFIILKIIEKELSENYGLKIKEFIYKNQKLKVFKSLKENNLKDNCVIKVVLE